MIVAAGAEVDLGSAGGCARLLLLLHLTLRHEEEEEEFSFLGSKTVRVVGRVL